MSTKCKENVSDLLNLHHQNSDLLTLLFSPARKAFPFKNECLTNLQLQWEQRRNDSRNIHTCRQQMFPFKNECLTNLQFQGTK
jgi:hypothetical protein